MKVLTLTCLFVFLLCLSSCAGNGQDLISAAQKDDISTVKALLSKGADVNAKADNGATALSVAKANGYDDIAQLLIKVGAKEL